MDPTRLLEWFDCRSLFCLFLLHLKLYVIASVCLPESSKCFNSIPFFFVRNFSPRETKMFWPFSEQHRKPKLSSTFWNWPALSSVSYENNIYFIALYNHSNIYLLVLPTLKHLELYLVIWIRPYHSDLFLRCGTPSWNQHILITVW